MAEDLLHRIADLAERAYARAASRIAGIAFVVSTRRPGSHCSRQLLRLRVVPLPAQVFEPAVLLLFDRVVNLQERYLELLAFQLVLVHADHDPLLLLDRLLVPVGRVGNLALGEAVLDGLDHSAQRVDLPEVVVAPSSIWLVSASTK